MMTGKAIQGFFLSGQAPIVASESARAFGPAAQRMVQRSGGDGVYPITAVQLGLARSGGRPLSDVLLAKMEAAFGEDFSAVRVHVGPQASRIGAIAFTTGNDLYFAPGQYQPDTQKGQQLIGHELAHVIQQRRGRVRTLGSGLAIVQNRALEAEADRLGIRAAAFSISGPSTASRHAHRAPPTQAGGPVQRKDRSNVIKGLMDENVDENAIQNGVASACKKVQKWAKDNGYSGGKTGRDAFFYSKYSWWNATTINQTLEDWTPDSAPPSKTAAMLMDYALWWKGHAHAKAFKDHYAHLKGKKKAGKLLSPAEEETRNNHQFESNSIYGRLAAQHSYATQAGASASTASLLWMLRAVGTVTALESKAVAHALVWYWEGRDSIKAWHGSMSGQKHTKFEVMIPLARHMGKLP
jgi:hypothetical protein